MVALGAANFSVKEKDETSSLSASLLFSGLVECLHSPLCRGLKVFLCPQSLDWSLPLTTSAHGAGTTTKDQSMTKLQLVVLALASVSVTVANAQFADRVVSYDPGIGYVAGFTNPATALGEPSRVNPFGEATDPFDPPYGRDQIVSIGAGGSLVLQFDQPILNHPHNIYGLDFTIFGNAGFIITNDFDPATYEWIGTPATDGSLFAQNTGASQVSVSQDGVHFFALSPANSPGVDTVFPTDSAGSFHVPVNPQLDQADFAGATLDDIRALYNGSAGGTSFDLSTARDEFGRPLLLHQARFVRIDVLSGKVEIDGIALVARHHDRQEHHPRRQR